MQVKSIAECSNVREHSSILSTFIKLTVVIKTFVLSLSEWPFYTGFTVRSHLLSANRDASDEAAYASTRLKRRWSPMSNYLIIR